MEALPPPIDLLPPLLRGLWFTIVLTLGGAVLAILFAFLAGLGRLSRDPIVRWYSAVYVAVFRGTPVLVLLFWFYYALPRALGIELDAIFVGILVLGLNVGAYGAEVVRPSILAVPRGQTEASIALNLTRWQRMRYVILPQAILMMLPPFGNLLIQLLKGTALVSLITTMPELTRAGMYLRDDTLRAPEIFSLLLIIYFVLAMLITVATRWLEKVLSHGMDYGG